MHVCFFDDGFGVFFEIVILGVFFDGVLVLAFGIFECSCLSKSSFQLSDLSGFLKMTSKLRLFKHFLGFEEVYGFDGGNRGPFYTLFVGRVNKVEYLRVTVESVHGRL